MNGTRGTALGFLMVSCLLLGPASARAESEGSFDFNSNSSPSSQISLSFWQGFSASINPTALPLGDQKKVTEAPAKGYIYACEPAMFQQAHGFDLALPKGPWINSSAKTIDMTSKLSIQGLNYLPNGYFQVSNDGSSRLIQGNGIPVGVPVGNFPVQRDDPGFQFDGNPNAISEQNISFSVPSSPVIGLGPYCIYKEVGITLDGVPIHGPLGDTGNDEIGVTLQDQCGGLSQPGGGYHRHYPSGCTPHMQESAALVGYALDGFGIYSPYDESGRELTSADLDDCHGRTSMIDWEGQWVNMYHYVMTRDFPYTVACFRGRPTRNAFPPLPGAPRQMEGNLSHASSDRLNTIYQEVLGRGIDSSGQQTYSSALANGWTLAQVKADVAASPEARARAAGPTTVQASGPSAVQALDSSPVQASDARDASLMTLPMGTAASNEEIWPSSSVLDGSLASAYSSGAFNSALNDRGVTLAAWYSDGPHVAAQVLIGARIFNGQPIGFPRAYDIYLTSEDNSKWLKIGNFTKQPGPDGVAAISVPQSLTFGVLVIPTILGVDNYGGHYFQVAELNLAVQPLLDPSVFDPNWYLARYPDLLNAFGYGNVTAAQQHWLSYGIGEGRQGKLTFVPSEYLQMYPDLQAAFGNGNLRAAVQHYVQWGRHETWRAARFALRSEVFNAAWYLANYPDLVAAFGPGGVQAATEHWLNNGISEGRQASPAFWSWAYLDRYPDLIAAFGATAYASAVQHYIQYGLSEGRNGSR